MTTCTWKVDYLDVKPSDGEFENVVVSCRWTVTAQNDTGETESNFGYANFGTPGQGFTSYSDLTEQQVLSWVYSQDGFDKSAIEDGVVESLNARLNPPTINPPLPWAETPVAEQSAE